MLFKTIIDRKSKTIKKVMNDYVEYGTKIVTDCHPSYHSAVALHGSINEKVNHSEGHTNSAGVHTNNVENLWSYLKVEMKTRRGITKVNIEDFIYIFQFRRRFLRNQIIESYRIVLTK